MRFLRVQAATATTLASLGSVFAGAARRAVRVGGSGWVSAMAAGVA